MRIGFFKDAYPSTGSPRIDGHHLRRITDQHRFYGRSQRDHFAQCGVSPDVLLHHHRVSGLEAVERRAITVAAVVAWEIRARDQRYLASFSDPDLLLCVLAAGNPC